MHVGTSASLDVVPEDGGTLGGGHGHTQSGESCVASPVSKEYSGVVTILQFKFLHTSYISPVKEPLYFRLVISTFVITSVFFRF